MNVARAGYGVSLMEGKMSNYSRSAWNPRERVVRAAMWMDDYFGKHQYGVAFEGDSHVYTPADVEIPLDLVLVPEEGKLEVGR